MTDATASGSPDRIQGLRSLGEGDIGSVGNWPDYVTRFGLTHDDVPGLIALTRETLSADGADTYDALKAWAPLHGWRALAQLRAIEAIPVLIEIGIAGLDDDAVVEDLPLALARIGPDAVPALRKVLADPLLSQSATMFVAGVLAHLATVHPDQRPTCIEMLIEALAPESATNDVGKGFVVSALLDIEAVEAIEPMREAFNRKAVDLSIAGDIEEVEIALGLRTKRSTPRPNFHGNRFTPLFSHLQAMAASVRDEPRSAALSPVRTGAKIGRNDPCPCGSGKKYKKCCLASDEVSAGFR